MNICCSNFKCPRTTLRAWHEGFPPFLSKRHWLITAHGISTSGKYPIKWSTVWALVSPGNLSHHVARKRKHMEVFRELFWILNELPVVRRVLKLSHCQWLLRECDSSKLLRGISAMLSSATAGVSQGEFPQVLGTSLVCVWVCFRAIRDS